MYEPEARVVNMVFDWAMRGLAGRAIALRLNEISLELRGSPWHNSSIAKVLQYTFDLGYYFDRTVDDEG